MMATADQWGDLVQRYMRIQIFLIKKAQHAYYYEDHSIMSDTEFDELWASLVVLEKAFPHLRMEDSPTDSVGH